MKITQEIAEGMFVELNADWFDGDLVPPQIRVTHTLDALGEFVREGDHREIRITDAYDRDDRSYRNTMLHEMIHLKIDQFGIRDNAAHGKVFMREAKRLNEHGWEIYPVSDGNGFTVNAGTVRKRTVFMFPYHGKPTAVAAERGGENTVIALMRRFGITSYDRVCTDDPMFARIPSCRNKLMGITLTPEQISYVYDTFGIDLF